jgi:MPBQ/MSBQ methyltransferase
MLPQRNGTILDVACGMGALSSKRLLRQYQPPTVIGINISDKQLATCRERAPGCRFLIMNATSLRFPDSSFDNILCVEAVFHFDTREQFLREAYRVLKPGGSLALSDVLLRSKSITAQAKRIPTANYVPSLQDYERSYVRCGFEDLRVIEAREPCWEAHRDHRIRFSWGKVLAGQASWETFQCVTIPRQSRELYLYEPLKASGRDAGASLAHWATCGGGRSAPEVQLLQPLIFLFLALDVFSDRNFVSPDG